MAFCHHFISRLFLLVFILLFSLSLIPAASTTANEGSVLDYAPETNVACPDITTSPLNRQFTPENQSISSHEADYISQRSLNVIPKAWDAWVNDGSAIGYNMQDFSGKYPNIGIALSGGGYRAAQYGAGVLLGLDARNQSASSAGTGGLLQVSSYMSALSGGSWAAGSLIFNDFPNIQDMVFGDGKDLSGWILDLDLAAPGGDDLFGNDNQWFFGSILYSIEAKAYKGIDTSITDPWSRMISYHFLNQTTRSNFFTNDTAHGAGQLFSKIPDIYSIQQHEAPFPIFVINSRPVNDTSTAVLTPNSTVYEVNPFEFGSWDPSLSAMTNVTYIGTHLDNNTPANSTACVTGFDQAGFMMGTSASLFNQILDFATNELNGFSHNDSNSLLYVLSRQLQEVRTRANDVANWPNPFQSLQPETFQDSSSDWLELIDGSSNQENVPFGSLFVKARELDVVVAVDASADDPVNLWPNGTSPIFTENRISSLLQSTHQSFPPIPTSQEEFLSTGVNQRPTFFGCDPTQNPPEWPLVIYLPNSPPNDGSNPVTNTDTFQISYPVKHTSIFIDQAFTNTIGGFKPNETGSDPNWGKCLQCAAIDRARLKLSPAVGRSQFCQTCFNQYCFEPQNPPSSSEIVGRKYAFVDPDPQGVTGAIETISRDKVPLIIGLVLLVVVVAAIIVFIRWRKRRKDKKYKRLTVLADEANAPWAAYDDRLHSFELSPKREEGSKYPATT